MLSYSCAPFSQLTAHQLDVWTQFCNRDPERDSPFLRPEFVAVTAGVRDDVRVGIVSGAGEPVAFFPFQTNGGCAQAVAGRLSECHGAIAGDDVDWSPRQMLAACNISSWHFDHLPGGQRAFGEFSWGTKPSPYVDLSEGFQNYRDVLKKSGSSLSQVERKARKLEREVGPLRFEPHSEDPAVFEALVRWKTAQHQRTNVLEIMQHDWVRNLLLSIRNCDSPGFAGRFSALYAGDELVAVHLGLRSRSILHMWFPAYNVDFEKYSPGLVLLLRLFETCEDWGLSRVEFGPGEERYKQNFKTGDHDIAEGMVSQNRMESALRAGWYATKTKIRSSRWRHQLEAPLVATRRLRQWLAFR